MRLVDLREIGRNIGVRSPSTKSKNQLITDIKDILLGKKEPYKTNLGRPYTPQYINVDDFKVDVIKKERENTKKIEELVNKFVIDLIKIIES